MVVVAEKITSLQDSVLVVHLELQPEPERFHQMLAAHKS